jgi:hypothetical protein
MENGRYRGCAVSCKTGLACGRVRIQVGSRPDLSAEWSRIGAGSEGVRRVAVVSDFAAAAVTLYFLYV